MQISIKNLDAKEEKKSCSKFRLRYRKLSKERIVSVHLLFHETHELKIKQVSIYLQIKIIRLARRKI